jgi:hypothetical protein
MRRSLGDGRVQHGAARCGHNCGHAAATQCFAEIIKPGSLAEARKPGRDLCRNVVPRYRLVVVSWPTTGLAWTEPSCSWLVRRPSRRQKRLQVTVMNNNKGGVNAQLFSNLMNAEI